MGPSVVLTLRLEKSNGHLAQATEFSHPLTTPLLLALMGLSTSTHWMGR